MKCILNICQKNPTWCILYSPQTPSNASPKCISWKSPAKVTLGARRSTPHAIQVYSPSSSSAQLAGRQERVKAQVGTPAVTDRQVTQMRESLQFAVTDCLSLWPSSPL